MLSLNVSVDFREIFSGFFADAIEQWLSIQNRLVRNKRENLQKFTCVKIIVLTSDRTLLPITLRCNKYVKSASRTPITVVTSSENASELSSIPKTFIFILKTKQKIIVKQPLHCTVFKNEFFLSPKVQSSQMRKKLPVTQWKQNF